MISSILPIPGGHQGYCTPPNLYLGEEAVLQHLPEAGSCCGVGEQQAPQEGSGTGREAGGQRVPHRADAPVQLLPLSRLERGAARQHLVPGEFWGGPGCTARPEAPPPTRRVPPLHDAAPGPDVRGHPVALAVQHLRGHVGGGPAQRPGGAQGDSEGGPAPCWDPPPSSEPRSPPAPGAHRRRPSQPQVPDLHLHPLGHQHVTCWDGGT